MIFAAEKVSVVGEVVWVTDKLCGVAFDRPIASSEVHRIRALANFVATVAVGKSA
jgi:hypothetical protein